MQQRNSSIPGIVNKIFMPQQRGSLSKKKQYWKLVLKNKNIKCIYLGKILSLDNISLDHYLPSLHLVDIVASCVSPNNLSADQQ
jgi:hypothetical protein